MEFMKMEQLLAREEAAKPASRVQFFEKKKKQITERAQDKILGHVVEVINRNFASFGIEIPTDGLAMPRRLTRLSLRENEHRVVSNKLTDFLRIDMVKRYHVIKLVTPVTAISLSPYEGLTLKEVEIAVGRLGSPQARLKLGPMR